MKKCLKCKIEQPYDNFHKKMQSKDGYREHCKICRKIERKERYAKNKHKEKEYYTNYKAQFPEKRKETTNKYASKRYQIFRTTLNTIKDIPCTDCQIPFPPCAMDFDHRNPKEKEFNISEGFSKPFNTLLKEIEKCDVVCANCHRHREHIRKANNKLHHIRELLISYKQQPCAVCNIKYPWYCMDFDHIDPTTKLFNLAKPKGSKEDIILEIKKCEIVCANCHRIRTFLQ